MSLRTSLPKIVTDKIPGPKSEEFLKVRKDNVTNAVGMLAPVTVDHAEGAMVQDVDGNIFMDWVAGIGVLNVGHSNPEVVEAVKAQCDKYFAPNMNVFNYYQYPAVAEKLNKIVPIDGPKKSIIVNTGAEADENAIKLARRYTGKSEIICYAGAFHGRSYMTMALTSQIKPYKFGFGPLAGGVHRIPYPYCYRCPYDKDCKTCDLYCAKRFEESIFTQYVNPDEVAAIILEPILGEGGFVQAPVEYMREVRKLCDKYGIVLIADEVQSGYCRTGKMYACEHWDVKPDIVVSAKSIGGGIPMATVTAKKEIFDSVSAGELGGTYSGNALATTSALKVLEILERDDYCGKANHINSIVMPRFEEMKKKYEIVGDVRGVGAMLAMEFVQNKASKEYATDLTTAIQKECMNHGLVILNAGVTHSVLRFLFPLVITDEQLNAGLDILDNAIATVSK